MKWNKMQPHERGQVLITQFRQARILQFKAVKCAIIFCEQMISMLPISAENNEQRLYWQEVESWLKSGYEELYAD